MDLKGVKILVTGGTGFLGHHVVESLSSLGADVYPVARRLGFDLRIEADALATILSIRPAIVVHLAGKAGDVEHQALSPAASFRDGMLMGMNVVHASAIAGARIVTVASSAIYAEENAIPFREDMLWKGRPHKDVAACGTVKRALLEMLRAYRTQHELVFSMLVLPELYGPRVSKGHIFKFTELLSAACEKEESVVVFPGTGSIFREYLHVNDAASGIAKACTIGLDEDVVNLGSGRGISNERLAVKLADMLGYEGQIAWNGVGPHGPPLSALDERLAKQLLGWNPATSFDDGLKEVVRQWTDRISEPAAP